MATSQEKKHVERFRVVFPIGCNSTHEIDYVDDTGEKYIDSSDYPNYFFEGSLEEVFEFAVSMLRMYNKKEVGDRVVFWPLGQNKKSIARIGIKINSIDAYNGQISRFSFMDDWDDTWYFDRNGEIRYDYQDEDDYRYLVWCGKM